LETGGVGSARAVSEVPQADQVAARPGSSSPRPPIQDSTADRLRRLAEAMAESYQRSESWSQAYEGEPELFEAWSSRVEHHVPAEVALRT
jgi:hypothetical protein